jgi:hypothetical protein
MRWVTATRRLVTGVPVLVKRSSGVSTRLPAMVVWLSAAMLCVLLRVLVQRSGPVRSGSHRVRVGWVRAAWMASAHAVVLAGLPDDRVAVVLAAVMHGHPHPEGQGGLAVPDRRTAVAVALVGGDPELGIQLVEDPLALADGVPGELGVGVGEFVG